MSMSILNLRASSAFKRALWTPAELKRFRAVRARDVRCTSYALPLLYNPGSAPGQT